jgi:5-oxoprolinase (ATP-hydrolysing) subunit A
MAVDGTVTAVGGTVVSVAPQSLCVHGDTPGAVEIARRVRAGLLEAGLTLAPFAA